jgi:hypothetical protein
MCSCMWRMEMRWNTHLLRKHLVRELAARDERAADAGERCVTDAVAAEPELVHVAEGEEVL